MHPPSQPHFQPQLHPPPQRSPTWTITEHAPVLLAIARATIRAELCGRAGECDGIPLPPEDFALHAPAGCFVSLHDLLTNRLRGCVGRLDAKDPMWRAVQRAAAGVLDDPRFTDYPVTSDELPRLVIEISLLSPLVDRGHPLDFDVELDGIYLSCGDRTGCFLPQVARETGWGREQLLERLCVEKMGLPPASWRSPHARLQTFTTIIIGPEPFDV
jgi:AmmeMemoRadiSam system protein A